MTEQKRKNILTYILSIIFSIIIIALIIVNMNILKEIEKTDAFVASSSQTQLQNTAVIQNKSENPKATSISVPENNIELQEKGVKVEPAKPEKVKKKPVYEVPLDDVILLQ